MRVATSGLGGFVGQRLHFIHRLDEPGVEQLHRLGVGVLDQVADFLQVGDGMLIGGLQQLGLLGGLACGHSTTDRARTASVISAMLCCTISMCRRATAWAPSSATLLAA